MIPSEEAKTVPSKKSNHSVRESRVERKLIIRNPFQKKEMELRLGVLGGIDESEIVHRGEMSDDLSEISSIMRTIQQEIY